MDKKQKQQGSLQDKSLDELREALVGAKTEVFNLRFQRATGNLENHRNIRKAKRDIARIHTAIRAKELGIAKGDKK